MCRLLFVSFVNSLASSCEHEGTKVTLVARVSVMGSGPLFWKATFIFCLCPPRINSLQLLLPYTGDKIPGRALSPNTVELKRRAAPGAPVLKAWLGVACALACREKERAAYLNRWIT